VVIEFMHTYIFTLALRPAVNWLDADILYSPALIQELL